MLTSQIPKASALSPKQMWMIMIGAKVAAFLCRSQKEYVWVLSYVVKCRKMNNSKKN